MTDTDSLVLEHLRHIRAQVDRMADAMADMKPRLSCVEAGMGLLNCRIDHIEERLAWIEQRLEVVD